MSVLLVSPAPLWAQAVAYRIGPQPLGSALAEFSRASGLQVSAPSGLTAGRASPGASGTLLPNAALAEVLAGTGLSGRIEQGTVVLSVIPAAVRASPASEELRLPTVDVGAARANSYSPIPGYVAPVAATASKSDIPLIETPQSVSVVTRDQIDDTRSQTLGEALRYTAGAVDRSGINGDRSDFVQARGFQLDKYIDGLYRSGGTGLNISPDEVYGYERIEVLRGPSSVLYGQANPGGVVNLVTKRPTETPFHEVELQTGSYGQVRGAFDMGGPLNQDGSVLYRLTGLGRTAGTQIDNVRTSRVYIAPALTWKATPDTTLTLLASYIRDPDDYSYASTLPAVLTATPGQYKVKTNLFVGDKDYKRLEGERATFGYLLDHRFDDVFSFHQAVRYEHVDGVGNFFNVSGIEDDGHTLDLLARSFKVKFDNVLVDSRAQAKFSTGPVSHNVLLGVDYQHVGGANSGGNGPTIALDIFAPNLHQPIGAFPNTYADRYNLDQVGVYAQDHVKIGRLTILGGVRQDFASSHDRDQIAGVVTTQYDPAFTYRVGAVYELPGGVAPYVSYSTAFQPQIGTTKDSTTFAPLRAKQYEAGVKVQPTGFQSFVTLSVYNLTEQNVLGTDPADTSFSRNIGEVRARGVDLEVVANLRDGLNLIMSAAYVDQTITRASAIDGLQDKHPGGIPRAQAAAFLDYKPVGGPLRGLQLGGGVRMATSNFGADDNSFKVPGYAVFDAVIGYDLGAFNDKLSRMRLQVNANNILDKTYVNSCYSASSCNYAPRRTVYANLKYAW